MDNECWPTAELLDGALLDDHIALEALDIGNELAAELTGVVPVLQIGAEKPPV